VLFRKILIANRGEIACRIIRTCLQMGIKTVAVYSEADRNSLHVRMADESYYLGASPPQESYLDMSKIISIARMSGAEAIHPGYGFVSQNPDFARACQEAGIRFIGPTPKVMEKMGDKLMARKLARKVGLPILPATDGAVDDSQALAAARELGFPLMVKATNGGGGIGIHIVESLEELESVVRRERALASNAFGCPNLYFERYLPDASHIEVQVMGDEHGNIVHLLERDCSVQRRNQKVIEESPCIKLTLEQEERLWGYALKLAQHIGYTNAGTVEFLASPQGEVYFLEMNTRLQVEHGVTEMITGLDMVELQLRVAAGEPLPISQSDIHAKGHAIEARIYPEDPETFIPSPGVIESLHEPSGEHIRVDSALFPGYEVTTHYEPLMAKLMCWGETREEARDRLDQALAQFHIEGIKYNIPALRKAVAYPSFIDGSYHTGLLSAMAESSRQNKGVGAYSMSENGTNGKKDKDKELAAAIGVALLLSANGGSDHGNGSQGKAPATWKLYGRREQMLSRTMGSRGWR
jgi:acetyl-CoA carboxylase biotin carboxylase subunit